MTASSNLFNPDRTRAEKIINVGEDSCLGVDFFIPSDIDPLTLEDQSFIKGMLNESSEGIKDGLIENDASILSDDFTILKPITTTTFKDSILDGDLVGFEIPNLSPVFKEPLKQPDNRFEKTALSAKRKRSMKMSGSGSSSGDNNQIRVRKKPKPVSKKRLSEAHGSSSDDNDQIRDRNCLLYTSDAADE